MSYSTSMEVGEVNVGTSHQGFLEKWALCFLPSFTHMPSLTCESSINGEHS